MKRLQSKLRLLALAAGSLAITTAGANAANSFYSPGDLVLYFQQEGGSNTVYVDLGNAASLFRGTATGPDAPNILNIINIQTQLNAAFGSWATATNLYMGVAGVYSTSTSNTVTAGDPARTLYVGQSRDSAGTVGHAQSAGYDGLSDTNMSGAATNITSMIAPFKDSTGANGYNAAAIVSPTSVSNIDNQNLFLAPGLQDTAFGVFAGGVQQVSTGGLFAASFGPASNVSMAVDLYRIPAVVNAPGQVGFGEALRVGTFEGTITLSNTGGVSFVTSAVPEPSTYGLLGGAAITACLIAVRRRKINA